MLDQLTFDPELAPGAHNAIETCLALRPGEHLTVITDRATGEIAASLIAAAREAGCSIQTFVLEDEAPRPLVHCPQRILAAVPGSDAVISCFQPQAGEIGSRSELVEVIEHEEIRYAHMVWISPIIMRQAMRVD